MMRAALPVFDNKVTHIKSPNWPQFRFEWHQNSKKVYLVRVGVLTQDGKETGDPIAENVETEGGAHNATLIWLRGYRTALSERKFDNGNKNQVSVAR